MKITVEGTSYDFDPTKIHNVEAMAVEKATGMMFAEWGEALSKGSALAQTALIWIVQKRVNPSLAFDAVSFDMASVQVDDEDKADASDPSSPPEPDVDS